MKLSKLLWLGTLAEYCNEFYSIKYLKSAKAELKENDEYALLNVTFRL
jgi:hypothetical protein